MLIHPLLQVFFLLNTHFKCCCKHRNGLLSSCAAKHTFQQGLSSENQHVYTETKWYDNNLH